jgi:hypothetical protein
VSFVPPRPHPAPFPSHSPRSEPSVRRVTQTLTLALTSLLLLALPASATEEQAPIPPAEGFGAGQWDGMLLAAVFGVIMGVVLFVDAYSGAKDEATHDPQP